MRFWLAASLLLVFAAGAALAAFAMRLAGKPPRASGVAVGELYSELPTYLVTTEEVWSELGLGKEQRDAIDDIIARHYQRVRQVRAELQGLANDLEPAILRLLTPEQQQRFQEIQERYRDRQIQRAVSHPLMNLCLELELTPEQIPWAYQILYDAELERRDAFRSLAGAERRELWRKSAEIDEHRDARLREILTLEQNVAFAEIRDRENRERRSRLERWERMRRGKEGARREKEDGEGGQE